MKCGIITMHKVLNYGATYQAFGLFKFLNSLPDVEAEFIDYKMNRKISCGEKTVKETIIKKGIQRVKNIKRHFELKCREYKFGLFWKQSYICSENSYEGDDELIKNPPIYDCYISGSDQLFNLSLTNHSIGFFLPFENVKKVSYSTSFGMNGLSEDNISDVSKYLKNYSAVSVREPSAAEILRESIGINPRITVDPVFLLDRAEWEKLEKYVQVPEQYILCYIMSDNPNLQAVLNHILSEKKLPIIIVKTCKDSIHVRGKYMNKLGPDEFIYVLSKASYVLTNSFHGCALSIIFGKKLFSLEEERFVGDKRYEALFSKAGISSRIVPYFTDWDTFDFEGHMIDGNLAYIEMKEWIDESKKFLLDNILQNN